MLHDTVLLKHANGLNKTESRSSSHGLKTKRIYLTHIPFVYLFSGIGNKLLLVYCQLHA